MEGIRQYILSIAAAGILCTVGKALLPDTGLVGKLFRLVCGIFLAFVLLSPVRNLDIPDFANELAVYSVSGEDYSQEGKNLAGNAMAEIIKSETQAYILDKAQSLEGVLTVELELDDSLCPTKVTLTGAVSPYAKAVLSAYLEETLGIAKEDQTWIG